MVVRRHKARVVYWLRAVLRTPVMGMHDRTRTFVPWDSELEAMYAPGGPLDPETYKG